MKEVSSYINRNIWLYGVLLILILGLVSGCSEQSTAENDVIADVSEQNTSMEDTDSVEDSSELPEENNSEEPEEDNPELPEEKIEDDIASFSVKSSSFEDGGKIDFRHARSGGNVSIPLEWEGAPEETKSFAVVIIDINASNFLHWQLVDIPPTVTSLEEGISETDELPEGSEEYRNQFGAVGYGGPAPPGSNDHEYQINVYALDVETLDWRAGYGTFLWLVDEHVIGKATMSGYYGRE